MMHTNQNCTGTRHIIQHIILVIFSPLNKTMNKIKSWHNNANKKSTNYLSISDKESLENIKLSQTEILLVRQDGFTSQFSTRPARCYFPINYSDDADKMMHWRGETHTHRQHYFPRHIGSYNALKKLI